MSNSSRGKSSQKNFGALIFVKQAKLGPKFFAIFLSLMH